MTPTAEAVQEVGEPLAPVRLVLDRHKLKRRCHCGRRLWKEKDGSVNCLNRHDEKENKKA